MSSAKRAPRQPARQPSRRRKPRAEIASQMTHLEHQSKTLESEIDTLCLRFCREDIPNPAWYLSINDLTYLADALDCHAEGHTSITAKAQFVITQYVNFGSKRSVFPDILARDIIPYLANAVALEANAIRQEPGNSPFMGPPCVLLDAFFLFAPTVVTDILRQVFGVLCRSLLHFLVDMLRRHSWYQRPLVSLLAKLSDSQEGCALITVESSPIIEYLESIKHPEVASETPYENYVLAKMALHKYKRRQVSTVEAQRQLAHDELFLAAFLMEYIKTVKSDIHVEISSPAYVGVKASLEFLSLLSLRTTVLITMGKDSAFVKALVALSPRKVRHLSLPESEIDRPPEPPVDAAICYGICIVLVQLTSTRQQLSDEQRQVAKLRAMTSSQGGEDTDTASEGEFYNRAALESRLNLIYDADCVTAMSGLAKAESQRVQEMLGRLSLNLVGPVKARPYFIRDGGFAVLTRVIGHCPSGASVNEIQLITESHLQAFQALAKLVITNQPDLLFPPPLDSNAVGAVRPLCTLLSHPNATRLQQYEALLALTNLATVHESVAQRMASSRLVTPAASGLFSGNEAGYTTTLITHVEKMMLDQQVEFQQAATELIGNMVNTEAGYTEYISVTGTLRPRLNLLLMYWNHPDRRTQLAAGNALVSLTQSPIICKHLFEMEETESDHPSRASVLLRILQVLDDDDEDEDNDNDIDNDVSESSGTESKRQDPSLDQLERLVAILSNILAYMNVLGLRYGENLNLAPKHKPAMARYLAILNAIAQDEKIDAEFRSRLAALLVYS